MSEAAPRSVNYADTLPLAISSTQNRRSYFPQNGQAFNKWCRITLFGAAILFQRSAEPRTPPWSGVPQSGCFRDAAVAVISLQSLELETLEVAHLGQ